MMTVLSFKQMSRSLYIFIAVLAIVNTASSATTCNERIDDLEGIVRSLKEKLENEIGVKQKVEDLEVALVISNRRIEELEAKVSELTFSEKSTKTKPLATPTNNTNGIKSDTGLILAKLKTHSKIKYPLWAENKMNGFLKGSVQSEHIKTENYEDSTPNNGQSIKIRMENDKLRKKGILKGNTSIHSTRALSAADVAFSAYLSISETQISEDHPIIFDTTVTNIGNHYNAYSGIFTASQHGVYVFTWTLYCVQNNGYIFSQLVVNSNIVGAMFTAAVGANYTRSSSELVVVELNNGDIVYVRSHPGYNHPYNLLSHQDWRSTFSGWKLF